MKIVCEKENGDQIAFGWFFPLWLMDVTGLGADYEVITVKSAGQDGESYSGAQAQKRALSIVLGLQKKDYQEQRNRLYSFFQPRSPGMLYYYEGDEARKTTYYVEKVEPGEDGIKRTITLSLICPDPKWYALDAQLTQLSVWQGCIRFPLHIPEPFAVTKRVNTLIGNVHNPTAVPMGLTVKFMASGTVQNPSLYDVNRRELMKINLTIHAGDAITITTDDGNKRVKLTRAGVTSNINNRMSYPPKWLKAYQGDNLYRYDAEEGIDNLSVSILSTQAYWGV